MQRNPGQGTSDGTYRNKRYFTCAPDSAVFVGLHKLTAQQGLDSKSFSESPKRDEQAQANLKVRLMETAMPSLLKVKFIGREITTLLIATGQVL